MESEEALASVVATALWAWAGHPQLAAPWPPAGCRLQAERPWARAERPWVRADPQPRVVSLVPEARPARGVMSVPAGLPVPAEMWSVPVGRRALAGM